MNLPQVEGSWEVLPRKLEDRGKHPATPTRVRHRHSELAQIDAET